MDAPRLFAFARIEGTGAFFVEANCCADETFFAAPACAAAMKAWPREPVCARGPFRRRLAARLCRRLREEGDPTFVNIAKHDPHSGRLLRAALLRLLLL